MEQSFKLDLTKLTPVEEKDRVKGNWYVVSDRLDIDTPAILRFHSMGRNMGIEGQPVAYWNNWFLIPPNLPGFPVAELPEEFELKAWDWMYTDKNGRLVQLPMNSTFKRTHPKLPELTIPSGTRAEQLAKLKEMLADFETF